MTCTDQLPYCCLAVLLSLLVVTMFSDKFTGGSFSRYTQPQKEERKGRGDEESAVYATATSLTDVVLVVMINPHRALDIPILQRHYVGVFHTIVFVGPLSSPASVNGTTIHRFLIGNGVAQHWAMLGLFGTPAGDNVRTLPGARGVLWATDDVILHHWNLRNLPRDSIWGPQFGVGNLLDRYSSTFLPPSMNAHNDKLKWAIFGDHKALLIRFFQRYPEYIAHANGFARRLSPKFHAECGSDYNHIRKNTTHRIELAQYRLSCSRRTTEKKKCFREFDKISHFVVGMNISYLAGFYGSSDVYYVPMAALGKYLKMLQLLKTHSLPEVMHMEIAIPFSLALVAEMEFMGRMTVMDLQYYWGREGGALSDAHVKVIRGVRTELRCAHSLWRKEVHGFHRCVHEHPFAQWVLGDSMRDRTYVPVTVNVPMNGTK